MNDRTSKRFTQYSEILHRLDDVIALETLREAGLFQALLKGPRNLQELAEATDSSAPRLRAFVDLVRHLGFLEKEGDRYKLVDGDEDLFDPEGPVRGNPGVPDFQRFLERRGQAGRVLREDEPLSSPATGGDADPQGRRDFLQHVHEVSLDTAEEVARLLSRFSPQRIADLGCGPGTYTLALLRMNPKATGVLVDRPGTASFVEELCSEAGLSGRAEFKARDILSEDFGADFDLVLLSENIHNFGPDQNQALFQNVFRSLRPGGRVAIKDTRIHTDRSGPLSALRFAYALSLFSTHGTVYPEVKLVEMLESAGLAHEQTLELKRRPESYLVVATRPA